MSMQIDPSHLPVQGTPGAAPVAGTAPVASVAPVTPAPPGTPAAPAPAPVAAAPAQTMQVNISPQARQTVGEAAAALQRQGLLLDALATAAGVPAPGAPGAGGAGAPGSPATAATPSQALAAAVLVNATGNAARSASSSTGASALLGTSATGTTPGTAVQALAAPAGTAPAMATGATVAVPSAGAAASVASRPSVVAGPQGPGAATGPAPTTSAAPTWPSGGVSAPLQSLLGSLVQQATAAVLPQRVLAIQPWPPALHAQVDGAAAGPRGGANGPAPAPLQTWLVRQGVVQTPEGARGVSMTVRVPAPWLQALEQAQTEATPTRSWQVWLIPTLPTAPPPAPPALQAAFAGPSQALQSGTFALALESPGGGAARTSALLTLELQPLLPAPAAAQLAVYGRDLPHQRQDPWLQMAALQASGQVERDENRARHGSAALCDTPDCPYLGRAACVQPFCAALRVVPQVGAAPAVGAASGLGPGTNVP